MGVKIPDFIAMWTGVSEAVEAMRVWSPERMALWWETTMATEYLVDEQGRVHRLGVRNGRPHHAIIAPRMAEAA